jgi:hypothetical protein
MARNETSNAKPWDLSVDLVVQTVERAVAGLGSVSGRAGGCLLAAATVPAGAAEDGLKGNPKGPRKGERVLLPDVVPRCDTERPPAAAVAALRRSQQRSRLCAGQWWSAAVKRDHPRGRRLAPRDSVSRPAWGSLGPDRHRNRSSTGSVLPTAQATGIDIDIHPDKSCCFPADPAVYCRICSNQGFRRGDQTKPVL